MGARRVGLDDGDVIDALKKHERVESVKQAQKG
jgi:hypothetical protein